MLGYIAVAILHLIALKRGNGMICNTSNFDNNTFCCDDNSTCNIECTPSCPCKNTKIIGNFATNININCGYNYSIWNNSKDIEPTCSNIFIDASKISGQLIINSEYSHFINGTIYCPLNSTYSSTNKSQCIFNSLSYNNSTDGIGQSIQVYTMNGLNDFEINCFENDMQIVTNNSHCFYGSTIYCASDQDIVGCNDSWTIDDILNYGTNVCNNSVLPNTTTSFTTTSFTTTLISSIVSNVSAPTMTPTTILAPRSTRIFTSTPTIEPSTTESQNTTSVNGTQIQTNSSAPDTTSTESPGSQSTSQLVIIVNTNNTKLRKKT